MIIRVLAASRSVELDEPRNFKAFAVRIEGTFTVASDPFELLARITTSHDREHAWVSEKALREWPHLAPEAWWQDGLTKMIAAVQPFGWVDPATQSIRAHIEYLP